ncbi:MAG: MFS transporter [Chlorobi bacterium]|nr:MFS transporter [Chlorobiota bacterium]
MQKERTYGFLTLFSLYIAQSIPMTFFSTVMPVIMRQHHFSLTAIGLLQLIKLPWILKFIWAPLIDGNSRNTNDLKKWIFSSELFYAVFIVAIGFFDLAVDFNLIVILLVLAFTASATQDIATDAFAILILKKDDRSIGNSMQSGGSFLGTVIGSGILLVVYSLYGWKHLMFGLAGFVLLALVPLVFYKKNNIKDQSVVKKISMKDIYLFFAQKGILRHVIMLFFFYSGIVGILTMLKPWMVDLGYGMAEIGVYSGIYGASAGFLSALVAGYIIKKLGLMKSVRIFLFVAMITTGYFTAVTFLPATNYTVIPALMLIWSVYGAISVSVYTIAMNSIRKGREGTDFTIQIVLTHLGSLIFAILSGKLAHNLGYRGLFILESVIVTLLFFVFPLLYSFKTSEDAHR